MVLFCIFWPVSVNAALAKGRVLRICSRVLRDSFDGEQAWAEAPSLPGTVLLYACCSRASPSLPRWLSGLKIHLQGRRYRRHEFDSWVRKICWRRAWQPTPLFCLEKSLAGYSSQGHKELDTTEVTEHSLPLHSPPFPGLDDASWNHTESSPAQSQPSLEGVDVHSPFYLDEDEDSDFLGGPVAKTALPAQGTQV